MFWWTALDIITFWDIFDPHFPCFSQKLSFFPRPPSSPSEEEGELYQCNSSPKTLSSPPPLPSFFSSPTFFSELALPNTRPRFLLQMDRFFFPTYVQEHICCLERSSFSYFLMQGFSPSLFMNSHQSEGQEKRKSKIPLQDFFSFSSLPG